MSVPDSLNSPIRLFYVLAAVKAIGLAFGLRLLLAAPGEGLAARLPQGVAGNAQGFGVALIVWYTAGIALCLLIAAGLRRRAGWAYPIALLYAGGHALGLLAAPFLGIGLLVVGVIGIALLVMLVRARAAGDLDAPTA